MLLQPTSPAPWPGAPSHPCAKCGELVPGLPVGGLCDACSRALARRAARIGRWVAIGTTLPLAVYITLTLPAERTARIVGASAVLIWYVLTMRIAKRIALEWLK